MQTMENLGVKLVMFMNFSPVFKGLSVALAGLIGLGFWYYMKTKWKEPGSFGFKVFFCFTIFVIFYGLYILVFQPGWWKLPY